MKTRDYYWTDSLVLKDGKLCIRVEMAQTFEPVLTVFYWPVRDARIDRESLPLPAHRADSGVYSVRTEPDLEKPCTGYDAHVAVYLVDGGATKAIAVENLPIPAPKTRKGIETRFHNGRWEKYLKSAGWTAAY